MRGKGGMAATSIPGTHFVHFQLYSNGACNAVQFRGPMCRIVDSQNVQKKSRSPSHHSLLFAGPTYLSPLSPR